MPHAETVRRWLNDDDEFRVQYARARDEQADYYADEIIGISDEEDDPQKARVRIDARKWVASKLKPKKYGDSLNLGGDLNLTMSDDQLESRLLKLLGKAGAAGVAGGEGAAGE